MDTDSYKACSLVARMHTRSITNSIGLQKLRALRNSIVHRKFTKQISSLCRTPAKFDNALGVLGTDHKRSLKKLYDDLVSANFGGDILTEALEKDRLMHFTDRTLQEAYEWNNNIKAGLEAAEVALKGACETFDTVNSLQEFEPDKRFVRLRTQLDSALSSARQNAQEVEDGLFGQAPEAGSDLMRKHNGCLRRKLYSRKRADAGLESWEVSWDNEHEQAETHWRYSIAINVTLEKIYKTMEAIAEIIDLNRAKGQAESSQRQDDGDGGERQQSYDAAAPSDDDVESTGASRAVQDRDYADDYYRDDVASQPDDGEDEQSDCSAEDADDELSSEHDDPHVQGDHHEEDQAHYSDADDGDSSDNDDSDVDDDHPARSHGDRR